MILAIADYVRGRVQEKPAALTFYHNVQAFGDPFGGGWMAWPYEMLAAYRLARNVYEAMRGYVNAEHKVKWANAHPEAWQIVGRVLALEMERDEAAEPGAYETWLMWHYGVKHG